MILSSVDYEKIWKLLQKGNKEEALNNFLSFISDYKNLFIKEENKSLFYNNKDIEEILDNNDFSKLASMNLPLENDNIKDKNNNYVLDWFKELDRKSFNEMNNYFLSKEIDILHIIQKNNLNYHKNNKGYNNPAYFLENSIQYAEQIDKFNYYPTTKEQEIVFKETLEIAVESYGKIYSRIGLKLLKAGAKKENNKNLILKCFKAYIDNNDTIQTQFITIFEEIKVLIKDWDMSNYFSVNDKKMLYAKEDGLISKKVTGMFFDLDLNAMKKKYKTTNTLINNNVTVFLNAIDIAMKNIPEYVGVFKAGEAPIFKVNILFETEVKPSQVDTMNNLMQEVIASKINMDSKVLIQQISSTILASFLEESLNKKDEVIKRNKI